MQPGEIVLPSGVVLRERYRIEHTISRGGFGNVYLAFDQKFNRDVAIKEAFFSDEATRQQFALEAEVLIHTDHKGVVRGFETFEHNGRFYLVMQFITGQNLEEMQIEHFKAFQRPMPETVVLPLMAQICSATQALHAGHILHRDIKPANIKVNQQGEPLLLDLGLAKLYKSPESVTLLAARAYTPGYAPPEQCQDDGTTTERTDIYALGATTYYALTGRQPWDAMRRLSELHLGHADMPPPSACLVGISSSTDAVVMQALDLDPAKRFASAETMQRALDAALHYATHQITTVACPHCGANTEATAEFCGTCGKSVSATGVAAAEQASQSGMATQIIPNPPIHQNPAPIQRAPSPHPPTLPMPSRPEPVAARIVAVKAKPRKSVMAGTVLFLSVCSLCPAGGALLSLLVIPMALRTQGTIRRSNGTLAGMGQATVGLIISLLSLVGTIVYLYLLFTRKINGPGA